jgi:Xaa-Pro aminopeptidase
MALRIKRILPAFENNKINALIITNNTNIRYLTQFPASESWLLVCPKKSFYLTDFRYILEARQKLKGIIVKQYTKSILKTLFELAKEMKVKTMGFEQDHLSVSQYKQLKQHCPKTIKLKGTEDIIEKLREVKEAGEIQKIKKALQIHQAALNLLKRVIKPGVSERDVLIKLENFIKRQKAIFSFDPIIASGPNSCYPHALVTDRKIRNNEGVLVDMGIDWQGYKSDLTRMFYLGKIPKLIEETHSYVKEAQQKAIAKIRAGVAVAKVDQEARNYLSKKKLAKYFGHALGHGVGLDIHESPSLSQKDPSILKEGMIVTVEPAVYIPHQFGIRIEDMVLVTKRGCKVLSDDIN